VERSRLPARSPIRGANCTHAMTASPLTARRAAHTK
jgi:hypothetical protein